MKGRILFVENDPDFLEIRASFLERAGYQVHLAASVEEAGAMLRDGWYHLAILDIRLSDNDDPKDFGGLLLAQNPDYEAVPKIMLTAYPSFEYVRQALGTTLSDSPPAADFLDKADGLDAMLAAIERVFIRRVRINRNLSITWTEDRPSGWLFHQLVDRILGEEARAAHDDRAREVEDLFRRLFYDSRSIRIGRELSRGDGTVALEVLAYSDSGPVRQLVVSCGRHERIAEENARYRDVVPKGGATSVMREAHERTQRFGATAYILGGADLEATVTLRDLYSNRSLDEVAGAIGSLYRTTLGGWHRQGRGGAPPPEGFVASIGLDVEALSAQNIAHRAEAICRDTLEAGLDPLSYTPHGISLTLPDGTQRRYPLASVQHHVERLLGRAPALFGIVHGHVTPDTVLVSEARQCWLIDYSKAGRGHLFQDFALLESAIKYELLDTFDLPARYVLEARLRAADALAEPLEEPDLPGDLQRALHAIRAVRHAAATFAPQAADAYWAWLWLAALRHVATYTPQTPPQRRKVARSAHALLTVAMLGELLSGGTRRGDVPPEAYESLWLDARNETLWVEGREVRLTEQEYRILAFLYRQDGELCTRKAIMRALGEEYSIAEESRLNTAMSRLLQKIEPDPRRRSYLISVRGRGYRLLRSRRP